MSKLARAGFDPAWWVAHYVTEASSGLVLPGLVMRREEESALFWGA